MSLLLVRPKTGTGVGAPDSTSALEVPVVHARIAWRPEDVNGDNAMTLLPWDGGLSGPASWTADGSDISSAVAIGPHSIADDSFGGGSCLQFKSSATADSGVDFALTGTFTSGRTYRLRAGLRDFDQNLNRKLRLGNVADYGEASVTTSKTWTWYTCDWTPSGNRTDVFASIQNDGEASDWVRYDHVEVYEKSDEVVLESLRVTRGARFDGAGEPPGTIDFSVLDPDDTYTPRNSASALYGAVAPGRRVHIRATYDGRLYPVAYGIVQEVTPDPSSKTVTVTCEDGLGELAEFDVEREFAVDGVYSAARAAALVAEALPADQHDLATDGSEAGTFADGTDSTVGVLDYLEDLNEATGTVHVCVPHVEAIRPWRYTTVSRASLTDDRAGTSIDDDFQRLSDVTSSHESLITRQRVTWVGYEILPSQVVVAATAALPYWLFTDEQFGSSERPEPEDIFRLKRVRGRKKRKRRKLKKVGERWVDSVLPIVIGAGETVEQVVDFSIPMQDVSVDVTDTGSFVTTTIATEPARVVISMTASSADTVTAISVTATPHVPLDEAEVVADTAGASIVRVGSPIDSSMTSSAASAEGLADYRTWRYGTARLRPSVTDQHHPVRQLSAGVGDHITLSADRWYISASRYVIRSLEHDVSAGGLEWETTYGLEELPSGGDWFTLGGGVDKGIDSSAVLAH